MGIMARAHGRATLALSITILALALPGAARAAITGSDLTGASAPIGCAQNATCILSQNEIDGDVFANVVDDDGVIDGFTFRHVTGDVAFVVLRQNTNDSFQVVDSTNYVTGSGSDEEESYTLDTPIPVQRGDFIGLALDTGATVGARDATGESTSILEFTDANPPVLEASDVESELFLQASWQANEDPDPGPGPDPGFDFGGGDDGSVTATPDPLAALKAGARPKVRISGKAARASKKYSVSITVRNPNGYRVKGRLSLKSKGLKLGSKAFSIAPESSKSVKVKLSGRARSRLARRRKMKVTASATFKGPIGKAGSARKSLTVKAPKRPKPRRRAPSGGGGGGGNPFTPRIFCVPHIEYDANGWAHAVPC
jgi:hypothetical protein